MMATWDNRTCLSRWSQLYQKKVQHHHRMHSSRSTQSTGLRESTFLSLMRLRGMECNSPSGYAEAFHCRKLVL